MLRKKFILILFIFLSLICSLSVPAAAASATPVSLNPTTAEVGDSVTAFGISTGDTWIAVKVLDNEGNILVLDFVKSDTEGNYSYTFTVPAVDNGILRVIGGYGSNVAKAELTVGGQYYSVTYDANSGTGTAPTESDKAAGATFTAATNSFTAPAGKRFKEWNTAANGSSTPYHAGATVTMPGENLTLYAIWEDIPSVPIGTITGTVRDSSSTPISGAEVNLTVSGSVYSAITTADGSYSITDVPTGTGYTVTAVKPGYTGASVAGVNVTADETTPGVDITLTSDEDGCLVTYKGVQVRHNEGTNTYDIRLIAIINTLNAKEVGFVFSKTQAIPTRENASVKATSTVYTEITASGSPVTAASLGGQYVIACTVTGIPAGDINVELHVRAFSTVGTVTKYTPVTTVTVADLID